MSLFSVGNAALCKSLRLSMRTIETSRRVSIAMAYML